MNTTVLMIAAGAVLALLLVIGVAVAVYVFKKQREFVHLDELCYNALSQISVQLNSRWDAVQALARLAAQYSKYESETLITVIQQRRAGNVTTPQQINEQQGALSQVMGRLLAVGESYPELKASDLYHDTMDGVKDYEEKVRLSRMVYNDTATKMNRMVRQWPTSFVASMLNFYERDYLTVDEAQKTNYPDFDGIFGK